MEEARVGVSGLVLCLPAFGRGAEDRRISWPPKLSERRRPNSAMRHVGCMAAVYLVWYTAHSERPRHANRRPFPLNGLNLKGTT